jgi:sulfotransferase
MKKLVFTSGLPRSCSTLLQNLLAQNPSVHATGSSLLHEFGYFARSVFGTEESKTMDRSQLERMYFDYVRAGCENAYNSTTDRPIVADKSRAWLGHLDQLFAIWPDAKVLVPVRDVRGILTSMEKKWRQHPTPFNGVEQQNPGNWTTVEKRVSGWLSSPPVGIAIERLYDALRHKDKLHFVHAETLSRNPESTMAQVWDYLELDPPKHDFDNVVQYTQELEAGWPYGDHTIRPTVSPLEPEWDKYLGTNLSKQLKQKFEWVSNL